MTSSGIVNIPGVKGGISSDMSGELVERVNRLAIQRAEVCDITFIERLGVFGQHDITIVREGSRCYARTVAPEHFFLFFSGAISLLLVGLRLTPRRQSGSPAKRRVLS